MAEGGMIRMNTDLLTIDIIAHPVHQIPVNHIQCMDPEEAIPLPGLGVAVLSSVILPFPKYLHPQAPHHLPTPL